MNRSDAMVPNFLIAAIAATPGLLDFPTPEPRAAATAPSESRHPGPDEISCGVQALYVLLTLEGHETSIQSISQGLKPGSTSQSMLELVNCCRSLGHNPSAHYVRDPGDLDSRPRLVFLRRGEGGHFLVVRLIDEESRIVQVLDGPSRPMLMDSKALLQLPGWTGLSLVLRSSRDSTRGAFRMTLLPIGCVILWFVVASASARRRPHKAAN